MLIPPPRPSRLHRSRRGTLCATVALLLVPILGVLALVLDGGMMMAMHRQAQSVADATALATAAKLYQNYSQYNGLDTGGYASKTGYSIAAANGFAQTGSNSTVSITTASTSGSGLSAGYVRVTATSATPSSFSAIWNTTGLSVSATSEARGTVTAYSNAGIIVLDPNGSGALSLTGGAQVKTNATIIVDSNSGQAVTASGNANINGSSTNITGNYSFSGGASFTGSVNLGTTPTSDPLAGLTEPSISGLTLQSASRYSLSGGSVTLYPGLYIGGISLSGSTSAALQPGIYYLQGGGLNLSGGTSVTGTGVMFYNAPGTTGGSISVSGSGTINLTPPTTGPYAGISFFQDRTSTVGASFSGGSGMNITGTFYFASALMTITGGGTATIGSQYISKDLSLTGNGQLSVPWSLSNVARKHSLTLVE